MRKVRAQYFYELVRTGTGKASAPYYIGQRAATERAASGAERDLSRQLERDAELVPCPLCSWVNADLVARHRSQRHRGLWRWMAASIVSGLIFAALAVVLVREYYKPPSMVPFVGAGVVFAMLGILVPVVLQAMRQRWRRRIDPNATYPNPVLPPGTPPALRHHIDAATGDEALLPATPRVAEPTPSETTVRHGHFVLPEVCCACLGPATTIYAAPVKLDGEDLAVPMCGACRRTARGRWWLTTLDGLILCAAVMGLVVIVLPAGSDLGSFGRWFVFGTFTLIGTAICAAVVSARRGRPFRFKTLAADRGVSAFAARNPEYTRCVAEASFATETISLVDEPVDDSRILPYEASPQAAG